MYVVNYSVVNLVWVVYLYVLQKEVHNNVESRFLFKSILEDAVVTS